MNVKALLNSPFPFLDKFQGKIVLSTFFGIFVYTFLLWFQPFGISNIVFQNNFYFAGFGFITFLIVLISLIFYPLTPSFDKDNWNIKKMFIFNLTLIFIISISNWIYSTVVGSYLSLPPQSFMKFIYMTFSVGIFPNFLFLLLLERFLNSKNEQLSNKLNSILFTKSEELQNPTIVLGNPKDKLSINLTNLICIKSQANYVEVYTLEKNEIKKSLLRCSLSKIKQQLEVYNKIKHCHRSFIVNTQHLIKITGNARNFNLHLKHIDFSIPVSRSFPINTIKD